MVIPSRRPLPRRGATERNQYTVGRMLLLGAVACVFAVQLYAVSIYQLQEEKTIFRQNVYLRQKVHPQQSIRPRHSRNSKVIKALFAADPPVHIAKPDPISEVKHVSLDDRNEKIPQHLLTPMYNPVDVQKMIALVEEHDVVHKYTLCRENKCDTVNDMIRAFNPWEKDVYLCGELIEAQTSKEIVKPCHENTRVYQHEPVNQGVSKMCLSPVHRQIVYPFVETVIEKHTTEKNHNVMAAGPGCQEKFKPPMVKPLLGPWRRTVWHHDGVVDITSWRRTMWHHDGVVDITLEGPSSDTYRISTGIIGRAELLRDHVYQIKGDASRTIIIVDPRLHVSTLTEGSFDIKTSHHSPMRIRVIVEAADEATADGEMSHTETMLNEFLSPVQFFKALNE